MFWERGGEKAAMVSSVSKQEQPVTTGRTATGCLCQEKGQWEQRGDAARAQSLHRLLGSTFQELSIQVGRH